MKRAAAAASSPVSRSNANWTSSRQNRERWGRPPGLPFSGKGFTSRAQARRPAEQSFVPQGCRGFQSCGPARREQTREEARAAKQDHNSEQRERIGHRHLEYRTLQIAGQEETASQTDREAGQHEL